MNICKTNYVNTEDVREAVEDELNGVDENDNKPEHKDASHDNEDTCDVVERPT